MYFVRSLACILVFMTLAVIPKTALASDDSTLDTKAFAARPVTEAQVMKLLYKFHGSTDAIRAYGEISSAIANAATQDPLFPGVPEGAEMTATILVAIAWHESNFRPSVVGDNGRSFGLYQIQPGTHKVDSKLLTLPRTASFVAIDLIRKSIKHCLDRKRHWSEALAWYAASSEYGAKHPKIIAQSQVRMHTAAKLFELFVRDDQPTGLGLLLSQKHGV